MTTQASEAGAALVQAAESCAGCATASALLGVAGSVLLAIPVIQGLKGRRAFEAAMAEYHRSKEAVVPKAGESPEAAEARVRRTFENARDTFMVDALGSYAINRWTTLAGLAALAAAFGLALV